jgi:hypothetical protein
MCVPADKEEDTDVRATGIPDGIKKIIATATLAATLSPCVLAQAATASIY